MTDTLAAVSTNTPCRSVALPPLPRPAVASRCPKGSATLPTQTIDRANVTMMRDPPAQSASSSNVEVEVGF